VTRERNKITIDPKIFLGNIASLYRDFSHSIKDVFFSQAKGQLNYLIAGTANFPQREKSPYSSDHSPYLPVKLAFMPARFRMTSVSIHSTGKAF
jgi:hypothetical protein